METGKKYVVLFLAIFGVATGSVLSMKAGIGITAWDALALLVANLTDLKIGTVGMILNTLCFFGQWVLLRSAFKKSQYFQLLVVVMIGNVVNLLFYEVFTFEITAYPAKVMLVIFSYIVMAFFVSVVMLLDLVTFPLEGFIIALTKNQTKIFAKYRQLVDVGVILLCLLLPLLLKEAWVIREGTIIGMILFGPLLGIFMRWQQPIFHRWGWLTPVTN